MKKFAFGLARVEQWRGMQARIEESKLERLYGELRAIESSEAALLRERTESERALLADPATTGADLAALDSFRRFSVAEHTRLEGLRAECSKKIAAQIQAVANRRREVKLLEHLRDKQLEVWTQEFHRELDAQADEAFLAKWRPRA